MKIFRQLALNASLVCLVVAPSICAAQELSPDLQKKLDAFLRGMEARSPELRQKDKAVRARYKDAIAIDALVPNTPQGYVGGTIEDWEKMAALSFDYGVDHVSFTAAVDETMTPLTIIDWIGQALKYWKSNPDKYHLVYSVEDIYTAKKNGKRAITMNFQGSNALGGNLNMVDVYYQLGIRQMNFAYNVQNHMSAGNGVEPERDGGLSKAGKRLVKEMNRVGMVIDCTHSSNKTCLDAAELSTNPIVHSHSNTRGVYDMPRNAPDEVVKAIAKTDGVICTNGVGAFLNEEGNAAPADIAKHVNYVKELVGARHTCYGSDYVDPDMIAESAIWILSNPEAYPPEQGYGKPSQVAHSGDIWGVVPILEKEYGWSEEEIRGFLGENLIRVYKANWK